MADPVRRDPWSSFQHDPRDPAVVALRASDADRNLIHELLTDAFADGRLDRAEYDERTAAALQARTLGQLPELVADLVPTRPDNVAAAPRGDAVPLLRATSADIQQRAEDKWRHERREAVLGFLGTLVLFGALFLFLDIPWLLIVPLLASLKMLRTLSSRSEIVSGEVKRLEKRQAKALEARDPKPHSDS